MSLVLASKIIGLDLALALKKEPFSIQFSRTALASRILKDKMCVLVLGLEGHGLGLDLVILSLTTSLTIVRLTHKKGGKL